MAMQLKKRAQTNPKCAELLRNVLRRYAVPLTIVLGCLFLLLQYLSSDSCHGSWHTQMLCDQYSQEVISGALCEDLCVKKTVYLSYCEQDTNNNLVYYLNNTAVVKIKNRYPHYLSSEPSDISHVYLQPETGTSMENFRKMVGQHLDQTLGKEDHSEFLQGLFNYADVNKDDKVSLAEAKTLWSLLKHNEFLLLHILKDNYHTATLTSFCGEAYLLRDLPIKKKLYSRPGQHSIFGLLFPGSYLWGLPNWVIRGKIAVGLLDFTLDVYQHHSHGSFYLCGLNETNIGYTAKSEVVIQDLSSVLPRQTVKHYLENVQCSSGDGCRLTEHCTTVCDPDAKVCTDELITPNLSLVCSILKPYLLSDIPRRIRADFLNLISRCIDLRYNSKDFEVQHSLILNDLKSLLWRQISTHV